MERVYMSDNEFNTGDDKTVLISDNYQNTYGEPVSQEVPQPVPQPMPQTGPQPMSQQGLQSAQMDIVQPTPQGVAFPYQQQNTMNGNVPFNGNTGSFVANIKSMAAPQPTKPKKKKTGLIIAIIAIVLLLGGGVGGYFLFFTPEKRMERSIDKGNEALKAENYQEAYDAYKKALEIDKNNIDVWYGMLSASGQLGDNAQFKEDYEQAINHIEAMDKDAILENCEQIVQIFLMADKVYEGDLNAQIDILKKGYELTGKSGEIAKYLVEDYFGVAEKYKEEDNLEAEVETYNTILVYEVDNQKAIEERQKAVDDELRGLIDAEKFDDAESIIAKYRDMVPGVDYDAYQNEIDNARKIIDAKHRLMESTLQYMSAGDYDSMREIDGSEDASIVCTAVDEYYIYSENGETDAFTGTGAGLFKFDNGYFFYYGEFVDGKPNGYGTSFLETDASFGTYKIYYGNWVDGKPNGQGTSEIRYVEYSDTYVNKKFEGNFTDGLYNGTMTATLYSDGLAFTGTCDIIMGKATKDVRNDYPDYDINEPAERIVYTVLLNDESSTYWWFTCGEATIFGTPGFE